MSYMHPVNIPWHPQFSGCHMLVKNKLKWFPYAPEFQPGYPIPGLHVCEGGARHPGSFVSGVEATSI